jgi:glutamate-1-semialdehyde 2,1-aminomutase
MSLLHTSAPTYRTNADTLTDIRTVVAGGVSSNMRALGIPLPLVVREARGCRLRDVEGNALIDLNMGYGPHLFGYVDQDVVGDIADQFGRGHMTGLPHELDCDAGGLIAELVPSVEQVRFANSGTEAVTSAVRLARANTRRSLVLTFAGHYHGWSETLLRASGTAADRPLVAGAPGMIPEALDHTLQVPWNDQQALADVFGRYGGRIAAAILEPVRVNSGVAPPVPGFLELVRELTSQYGALLIFDEVITGFRVARGGAQERYGVEPDLTVLSKVLGGGFPVAAFGGSRQTMAPLARNEAFHAGVYAGNHAAIRAVVSMLSKIRRSAQTYARLEEISAYAEQRLTEAFAAAGRPVLITRVGSVMSVATLSRSPERLPTDTPVVDFATHRDLQMRCQRAGVYFHPNPLEPWFLSTAHARTDIDEAVDVIEDAVHQLA